MAENKSSGVWQVEYSKEPYRERYRNQFHFSPKVGWMNDINGAWYADGKYHLTYQADPNNLRNQLVHWGYATSPDLLHWTQKDPVLIPGKNCKGPSWSGTAVVDTGNTAGFGAGAYILFYTDIMRGQCLAYSVDKGETFQDYSGNPVVSLDNTNSDSNMEIKDQRDPKVFWHDDTRQWVMMVFQDRNRRGDEYLRSMQFYTSNDLKNWIRQEDFYNEKFFECPDVFCLPVDGNPNDRRWVFQSASSYYVLGRFDGKRLIVDECPGEMICQGPDIYAGQSFSNHPEGRVITMYWLDHWNGSTVPTEPWTNSASFPTELELKTFPEGIRLVRNPIREIARLYDGPGVKLTDLMADEITNPLHNLYARCFDLTVQLDFSDSSASQVVINLMDKTYTYDISGGILRTWFANSRTKRIEKIAFSCMPSGKQIKFRFLVDADCVELFVNDGRRTYAEEYGFFYISKVLSLYADRQIRVPLVEFYPIKSIW